MTVLDFCQKTFENKISNVNIKNARFRVHWQMFLEHAVAASYVVSLQRVLSYLAQQEN
jgi:hypothetical protein